jgi:hypothetical protein
LATVTVALAATCAIMEQVDASLARLDTDYIDLYQIHRFDPEEPAEEIMEALHDVVKAGKARYIGAARRPHWSAAAWLLPHKVPESVPGTSRMRGIPERPDRRRARRSRSGYGARLIRRIKGGLPVILPGGTYSGVTRTQH